MKLVNIDKISYDPQTKGYVVMLQSYQDEDCLEIVIGAKDAKQISLAKEGVNLPRPSTHDLLLDIIESFDIKFKKIIITDYKSSTFLSKIILYNVNLGEIIIDSRPSDAIILSLCSACPLYVNSKMFKNTVQASKNKIATLYATDNSQEEVIHANSENLLKNLNHALDKAILSEEYEMAAKIRDRIKLIDNKDLEN